MNNKGNWDYFCGHWWHHHLVKKELKNAILLSCIIIYCIIIVLKHLVQQIWTESNFGATFLKLPWQCVTTSPLQDGFWIILKLNRIKVYHQQMWPWKRSQIAETVNTNFTANGDVTIVKLYRFKRKILVYGSRCFVHQICIIEYDEASIVRPCSCKRTLMICDKKWYH